jgi:polyhydroxyalkanoate synthesis regulator protein
MEVITKYQNRKLYSKKLKKYVNNNYLVDLVRLGDNFQVLEHSTGNDLTALVLTTCLLDLNVSKSTIVNVIKESLTNG